MLILINFATNLLLPSCFPYHHLQAKWCSSRDFAGTFAAHRSVLPHSKWWWWPSFELCRPRLQCILQVECSETSQLAAAVGKDCRKSSAQSSRKKQRAETESIKSQLLNPETLFETTVLERSSLQAAQILWIRGEGKNETYVSSLFTSNTKSRLEMRKKKKRHIYRHPMLPWKAPMISMVSTIIFVHHSPKACAKNPTQIQKSVIPACCPLPGICLLRHKLVPVNLVFLLPIFSQTYAREEEPNNQRVWCFRYCISTNQNLQIKSIVFSRRFTDTHQIVPSIVIGGERRNLEKKSPPGKSTSSLQLQADLQITLKTPPVLTWVSCYLIRRGWRLIDLGFGETITKITDTITRWSTSESTKVAGLLNKRVNVLCSATMK